ncbi:MAG: hypothetical protein H5T64_11735 [Chloroflexi bacterium]|nr:hypothetical protein [Chloroflexota bacterium]
MLMGNGVGLGVGVMVGVGVGTGVETPHAGATAKNPIIKAASSSWFLDMVALFGPLSGTE